MYQLICDLCGEPIKYAERSFKIREQKSSRPEWHWVKLDAHDECVRKILSAEKVGKWERIGNIGDPRPYACSECRYAFNVETSMLNPTWNYCPNCGARMKGEKK